MKKPKKNRYSGDAIFIGLPGYDGPHQEMHRVMVRYKWAEEQSNITLELTPELEREARRLGLNIKPVK